MAKNKIQEEIYKAEGLRRMLARKKQRFEKYRTLAIEARDLGIPLAGARLGGSWPDPDSPTGYSQKCSYEAWGTCQSPCNGDC
jgi:hypothetical protein